MTAVRAPGLSTPLPTALPTSDALVADLAAALREAVRRDGVDPQRDVARVRALAEQVLAGHDERSLTGRVPRIDDAPAVLEELVSRIAGFGPLQRFLDDPSVEEVWINDPRLIRKT